MSGVRSNPLQVSTLEGYLVSVLNTSLQDSPAAHDQELARSVHTRVCTEYSMYVSAYVQMYFALGTLYLVPSTLYLEPCTYYLISNIRNILNILNMKPDIDGLCAQNVISQKGN